MPTALLILLGLTGFSVALIGSPRASLWVLVTTWLLVPGGARLPGLASGPLFIHRVILIALLLGLLRRAAIGQLDRGVFTVRGVHLAFAAYLAVSFLDGVLLAESSIPYQVNTNAYLNIVEQAVWFVVALALFRAVGARSAAGVIFAGAGVLAAITVSEHFLSWSYSQWFTRHLLDPDGLLSLDLGRRGPHERVRGSATFALEFGWIAAMLVPLTAAVAAVSRRTVAWLVPAALTISMLWSWSRSAYSALAIGAIVLLLGAVLDRPRPLAVFGLSGLGLTALLLQGSLREVLDLGSSGGETDLRFERLPAIFEAVAHRPVFGLGLGGLLQRRVRVVDVSWVNTYATIGVIGVIALAALLLVAIHTATRFVLARPAPGRLIAAGAAAAAVAAPLGLLSYDLVTLRASTETLWALSALALVANEELGVLPRSPIRRQGGVPALAVGLGVIGLVVGVALAMTTPERFSIDATFTTVAPRAAAVASGGQPYVDKVLSQTACTVIDAAEVSATVRCQDLDQLAGGVGTVRVESNDPVAVQQSYDVVRAQLEKGMHRASIAVVSRDRGRPNWATTAPLWLMAVGAALGSLATDERSPLTVLRKRGVRPSVTATDPIVPGGPDDRPGRASAARARPRSGLPPTNPRG